MAHKFCFLFFLLTFTSLNAQVSLNMELFGQYDRGDSRYSGSWAYTDSLGNEYALLGARTGLAAYPIDDLITEVGFISGPNSNWREVTVIGHHAYVSTEGSSDTTGMQVIDLQYLPDSLHLLTTYDSTFTEGHIIQRDIYSDESYIYVMGTLETEGTHIMDVSDPANPVEVGLYDPGYYIHDCFIKGDLMFAAAFFEARMDVVDISDRSNPVLITQIEHFDGNTHSSWMTEDDRFLIIHSELDGTPARIYNIEDLNNVSEVAIYTANYFSLVHNPYIRGNYAFMSHNTEGIRVVDIYDPKVPVEVGFYDTWDGLSGGFNGLWSACPFFPSGKIIGGNRHDGLYVWTFNNTKAGRIYATILDSLTLAPLTNIEVVILETNDTLYTDFNGQIKWGALAGDYSLSVSLEGYLSERFSFMLSACDSLNPTILLQSDVIESTNNAYRSLPNLEISPNPSDGQVQIKLSEWKQGSSLQIFNALGQRVFHQKTNDASFLTTDLSSLGAGTFLAILMDEAGQALARNHLVLMP